MGDVCTYGWCCQSEPTHTTPACTFQEIKDFVSRFDCPRNTWGHTRAFDIAEEILDGRHWLDMHEQSSD